jgi:hypothetical protein
MLVTVKVAASYNQVSYNLINYLVQKGHIKKHYIYGNLRHYAVDLDEAVLQLELGRKRKLTSLRNHRWSSQTRGVDGRFKKKLKVE